MLSVPQLNKPSQATIRLLLADDHQLFLDGMLSLLSTLPNVEVVGTALNGQKTLDWLQQEPIDLVLLDINMPVMDGMETTLRIKASYPSVRVLILTMHHTAEFISKLIASGADGYLLKNTGQQELLHAINQVMGGQPYFGKNITDTLINTIRKVNPAEPEPHLTKREIDVLRLITQELTTQEIADALNISSHTVETHRRNLQSKLNLRNTAGLVKYAISKGLAE